MSLINEALKKAQRQRSLETAPLASAPSGVAAAAVATHVRAATRKRSLAPLWFGLGVLGIGVGATVLVMRHAIPDAPPAPPPVVAASPRVEPLAPPPNPAPSAVAPAPAPEPLVMLPPVAPVAAPARSPAQAAAEPAPAPTPVAPVATAPLTPAEREAQVYSFLNTIRLTGVRGLDREARVLMNERVWRLNDMVAPELGLRLSAVRPNLLVFTDAQGRAYEKPY